MTTFEETRAIFRSVVSDAGFPASLASEEVALEESLGRVLSADVVALENNPPFDNSAMDGFALNAVQCKGLAGSPEGWIPVTGLVVAGDGNSWEGAGVSRGLHAVEIMTGAPIPHGDFDTVIRVEDVETRTDSLGKKWIRIESLPRPNSNIRRIGEDIRTGELLVRKGHVMCAQDLMVLATMGIAKVNVRKKLRCAILSTGRELVEFSQPRLEPGQIRNSTGPYLDAVLADLPLEVRNHGIIADDREVYLNKVREILEGGADILVSTGAVSMGVFDFVRPALEALGADIHFHKCAIRPGKPVLFASVEIHGKRRFVFGVPGNPISTLIGYGFFIRPFVEMVFGLPIGRVSRAVLAGDVEKPRGLRCFFKARFSHDADRSRVEILKGQASSMVKPLLMTDVWAVLPEESEILRSGTEVEVIRL